MKAITKQTTTAGVLVLPKGQTMIVHEKGSFAEASVVKDMQGRPHPDAVLVQVEGTPFMIWFAPEYLEFLTEA